MDYFGVRLKNASSNHRYTWELPDCLILRVSYHSSLRWNHDLVFYFVNQVGSTILMMRDRCFLSGEFMPFLKNSSWDCFVEPA